MLVWHLCHCHFSIQYPHCFSRNSLAPICSPMGMLVWNEVWSDIHVGTWDSEKWLTKKKHIWSQVQYFTIILRTYYQDGSMHLHRWVYTNQYICILCLLHSCYNVKNQHGMLLQRVCLRTYFPTTMVKELGDESLMGREWLDHAIEHL